AATAAEALADNATRMAAVLDALKRAGVAPRDTRTANVSLSPQYRYADNQPPAVTGYQANNSVAIRFRDIAKAGAILDALVKQGANQIDGPNLSIDQPDAALDEARADAVKKAQARAQLYAKAAGLTVSRIVSISESGQNDGSNPQPPRMLAGLMKADASTSISTGETDVAVTLNVRFLLK
ncbi:MAG: SIMPL domain-containing protein, partial [Sphingomonas sp.]|nr:SIMPL domain-containing protein [Sphingomonas sp.]